MTLLNEYSTAPAAYIAKGMLEAHGIKASVVSDALSSIFPTPDGMAQYALYVDDDNEEQAALELLKQHGDLG